MSWFEIYRVLWMESWTTKVKVNLAGLALARVSLGVLDAAGLALTGLVVSIAMGTSVEKDSLTGRLLVQIGRSLSWHPLIFLSLCALAFFLAKALVSVAITKVTALYLARLEISVADSLFTRLLWAQTGSLAKWSRPELVHGVTSSVRAATSESLLAVFGIVAEMSVILAVSTYLTLTNPVLFLTLVGYFAAIMGVLHYAATIRSARLASVSHQGNMKSQSIVMEALDNYRYIFTSRNIDFHENEFTKARSAMAIANAKYQVAVSLPRYMVELAIMFCVASLAYLSFGVPALGITTAIVTIFLVGVFRLFSSLLPIQGYFSTLRRIGTEAQVMAQIQKLPKPTASASGGVLLRYDIELKEISFRYPESEIDLFMGLNLDLAEGNFLAIQGRSGAGKSTLVDVIIGLQNQTAGRVLIGGMPPMMFEASNPGAIAYVPQSTSLIHGSLTDNVCFGRPFDHHRLSEVLELVGLGHLMTDSGEVEVKGKLSGGEAQRLALARALYVPPKILVLDEPTSALDEESERVIIETLKGLKGRMTIILISHTSKMLQDCDVIIQLEGHKSEPAEADDV